MSDISDFSPAVSGAVQTGHGAIVVYADGARVKLSIRQDPARPAPRMTIGRLVTIQTGRSSVVGMVAEAAVGDATKDHAPSPVEAWIDMIGEILPDEEGRRHFRRGVGEGPAIGDAADLIDATNMHLIYGAEPGRTISIGHVHQDHSIPACVRIDELLSMHFAVLGSTGVGKSSGVAVILREILRVRPETRIFLLDSHGEYGTCFGTRANIVNAENLKLPFWLFNFEEFLDIVYAGRGTVSEEAEILAELIPIAKSNYNHDGPAGSRLNIKRIDPQNSGFTADTPIPYLFQDLLDLIDERMGRLDNRPVRMHHHRLLARLNRLRNNPRYQFMFKNANVGGDTMAELLAHLFRLEPSAQTVTVAQLAGLPGEANDAVVCMLMRMAFEFGVWSKGAMPLLFVCEEAHRYAAASSASGYDPGRRALAHIAKEGRKYGVFLGLVTQRPAELDPNIISQCSTLFAMRMSNERDQALLRSAVSDISANLLSFVPSLGTREVVAFGEGVPLPVRLCFKELPADCLPGAAAAASQARTATHGGEAGFVRSVVERWRGATLSSKPAVAEAGPDQEGPDDILAQIRDRLLRREQAGGRT